MHDGKCGPSLVCVKTMLTMCVFTQMTTFLQGAFRFYCDCTTRYYTQNRSKVVRLCYKMVDSFNLKLQTLTRVILKDFPVFYGRNIKKDRKKVYIYGKYQLKLYLFGFE